MSRTDADVARRAGRRRLAPFSIAAVAVSALLGCLVVAPAAGQSSEIDTDLAAQGEQLASRFLTILSEAEEEKRADLEAFLAPEFQLLRSDGDLLTRDAYLESPASVLEFSIERLVVTGSEDLIVTSYLLASTVTIEGVTRTTTAPRLTVFSRHGEDWLLAAHANFTPLDDAPAASPAP
ncbi:hypothetical protein BH23CHL8_BH23CHL8_29480 [soil metagenome]